MILLPFELNKHKTILNSWYQGWNQEPPPDKTFSPTGYLVYNNETPICAGFLCKTDAGFAIIYNYISDPKSDKLTRSEALDMLSKELTDIATKENFYMVCASTANTSVAKRFEKLGYVTTHEQFINLGRILCPGFQ